MGLNSKIIAISANMSNANLKRILQLGIKAHISKNSSLDEFINAFIEVAEGGKYLCNETKELLANNFFKNDPSGMDLLTAREMTIIELIRQGLSSRQMVTKLGIAVKTVEAHRYNILKKMKLNNTAALVNSVNMAGMC
jgi:DNA-binding NarL/FixJ family response regulator